MQATVASFDAASRSGQLLADDGTPMTFGPEAFEPSGLRLLRLGQRVQVERAPDGTIEKVSIPTF